MHHQITVERNAFTEICARRQLTVVRPAPIDSRESFKPESELLSGDSLEMRCAGDGYQGWAVRATVTGRQIAGCCEYGDRLVSFKVDQVRRPF